MWLSKRIAVIVPAFNEERLLGRTLDKIPSFVDDVIVVDDASADDTARVARDAHQQRLRLVHHDRNRGVGAAIVTGYLEATLLGAEILVVMAGDQQMDPADLPALLEPVARGEADYAKGNRFRHPDRRQMPLLRRIAGRVLGVITRIATGLDVTDTQCGYTALCAEAARRIPLRSLWPRYGYPNDLLGMIAQAKLRVVEVAVRPVYGSERSGIRPWHAAVAGWLAVRRSIGSQDSRARSMMSSAQRSA